MRPKIHIMYSDGKGARRRPLNRQSALLIYRSIVLRCGAGMYTFSNERPSLSIRDFEENLNDLDRARFKEITHRRSVPAGDCIYRMNDPFDNLYVIHAGSVKMTIVNIEGLDQVTGFYLPGEMFGLDGLVDRRYTATVEALEDGQVDEISYEKIERLCATSRDFRHYFLKAASRQIVLSGDAMLIGAVSAERRFARFLCNFSTRYSLLGYSASQFNLPMTRYDIGSYLYLTSESVSRLIRKFMDAGLIDINKREVRLLDIVALECIAEGTDFSRQERHRA